MLLGVEEPVVLWQRGSPDVTINKGSVNRSHTENATTYRILRNLEVVKCFAPPGQQGGSLVLIHHMAEHHAVSFHLDVGNINFQSGPEISTAFFG